MYFQHSEEIWRDFPQLVPGALLAEGISACGSVEAPIAEYTAVARARLAGTPEGQLPEVSAWRHAFSAMGLKPTQYRCASEALLRRFRKEGSLPRIHPLVDVCNAASLAFAVPVAALDVARVSGDLQVRYAAGDEDYLTFSGEVEHPDAGEVVFADAARRAHARRWTNRQSGYSAVQATTTTALIVAEAMHASASADVPRLVESLADALHAAWGITPVTTVLSPAGPRFPFGPRPCS